MDFYLSLDNQAQEKVEYVFKLIRTLDFVPENFLKHIHGTKGLYEIRVKYEGNIFRVFCCFDQGIIIVLFNGFKKKTSKTPKNEIAQALKLMTQYFEEKKMKNEKS